MSNRLSVVVSCIDYRFWPDSLEIFEKKYGKFDLIELAGGAKNLSSPTEEADSETLLENIGISVKLHNASRVILVNHLDCGAYGGSKKFEGYKQELDFHRVELEKAKQIIMGKFPALEVEKVFLTKEDGKVMPIYE